MPFPQPARPATILNSGNQQGGAAAMSFAGYVVAPETTHLFAFFVWNNNTFSFASPPTANGQAMTALGDASVAGVRCSAWYISAALLPLTAFTVAGTVSGGAGSVTLTNMIVCSVAAQQVQPLAVTTAAAAGSIVQGGFVGVGDAVVSWGVASAGVSRWQKGTGGGFVGGSLLYSPRADYTGGANLACVIGFDQLRDYTTAIIYLYNSATTGSLALGKARLRGFTTAGMFNRS